MSTPDDDDDNKTYLIAVAADEWGDSRTRYLTFDGENWVMYDLSLLPQSYQRLNTIEHVQFTFQTNGPDGLIWFSGNARDNLQLSLRVRCHGLNIQLN